jgi:glycosyltransferase involved in cell wall biosynthesis
MGIDNYVIVTPCKNEEKNLPKLADSIVNQIIKPKLWGIVDDGSTDKTPEILENLISKHEWIKTIRLNEKPRDMGIHLSQVYRSGFEYVINYCAENEIEYEFIGCVDADINFDNYHFKSLIAEFEKNPNLGVCSGNVGNLVNGRVIWINFRENIPSGGDRLWRKKCFEDTGGYLLTCSPDSVSNVKAKLRGWDIKQFENIKAISTRAYASAEGQWKGYRKLGANNYFIGYTPLHVLSKGIKLLYSRNGYFETGVGLAYISGYFSSYLNRNPRLEDPEIIDYYQHKRLKEILRSNMKLNIKKRL